jgi:hypothetical protein
LLHGEVTWVSLKALGMTFSWFCRKSSGEFMHAYSHWPDAVLAYTNDPKT